MVNLDAESAFTDEGRNVQFVFHNKYGVNEIDYFLERTIETRASHWIVPARGSWPRGCGCGTGRSQDLRRSWSGGADFGRFPGMNSMDFSLVMPIGAELQSVAVDYFSQETNSGPYPAVRDIVEIPAGGESVVEIVYRVPSMIELDNSDLSFVLVPQNLVNPDRYMVSIEVPRRFRGRGPVGNLGPAGGADSDRRHRQRLSDQSPKATKE